MKRRPSFHYIKTVMSRVSKNWLPLIILRGEILLIRIWGGHYQPCLCLVIPIKEVLICWKHRHFSLISTSNGSIAPLPPKKIRKKKKTKFLLSTGLQMEIIMFFVIPKMPSKTFVMVSKKLPDHFEEAIPAYIVLFQRSYNP